MTLAGVVASASQSLRQVDRAIFAWCLIGCFIVAKRRIGAAHYLSPTE
jgi:hypothetical protein